MKNIINTTTNATNMTNITLPGNFTITWPPPEGLQIITLSIIIAILFVALATIFWKKRRKSATTRRYILTNTLSESDTLMLNKLKDAENSIAKIVETIHSEYANKDDWQQKYITARLESTLRDMEKK